MCHEFTIHSLRRTLVCLYSLYGFPRFVEAPSRSDPRQPGGSPGLARAPPGGPGEDHAARRGPRQRKVSHGADGSDDARSGVTSSWQPPHLHIIAFYCVQFKREFCIRHDICQSGDFSKITDWLRQLQSQLTFIENLAANVISIIYLEEMAASKKLIEVCGKLKTQHLWIHLIGT